jgi:hypothetical protein
MKKNYKTKEVNKLKLIKYIALSNKKSIKVNETNARQSKCSTRK